MSHFLARSIDWNQIEPRIREHVKALLDAGYETTGSCGHDMWISVNLEPSRLTDLHADLKRLGYKDFKISYEIHEGFHRWKSATIQFGGDLSGDGKPFDLVLLKVEPDSHPLYFVITARRWPDFDRKDGHDAYFYDEHTCPTNWTGDIVAVISDGDEDPHGFASFVRRITAPEGMDESGDMSGGHEGALWTDLFPETDSNT